MLNEYELEFLKRHVENPNLINSYNEIVQKQVEDKLNEIIAKINTDNYTKGVDEFIGTDEQIKERGNDLC